MLIYGGINDRNVILNDALVFSMETKKWVDVYPRGESPGPLAYHTSVAVYPDGFTTNP
jgi:hypothetical protein